MAPVRSFKLVPSLAKAKPISPSAITCLKGDKSVGWVLFCWEFFVLERSGSWGRQPCRHRSQWGKNGGSHIGAAISLQPMVTACFETLPRMLRLIHYWRIYLKKNRTKQSKLECYHSLPQLLKVSLTFWFEPESGRRSTNVLLGFFVFFFSEQELSCSNWNLLSCIKAAFN